MGVSIHKRFRNAIDLIEKTERHAAHTPCKRWRCGSGGAVRALQQIFPPPDLVWALDLTLFFEFIKC
jgi:hypothetical protein